MNRSTHPGGTPDPSTWNEAERDCLDAALLAYGDGALGEMDKARLEQLLDASPQLWERFDDLHREQAVLREVVGSASRPEGLGELQRARIRLAASQQLQQRGGGTGMALWQNLAIAAGALLAIGVLGGFVLRVQEDQAPQFVGTLTEPPAETALPSASAPFIEEEVESLLNPKNEVDEIVVGDSRRWRAETTNGQASAETSYRARLAEARGLPADATGRVNGPSTATSGERQFSSEVTYGRLGLRYSSGFGDELRNPDGAVVTKEPDVRILYANPVFSSSATTTTDGRNKADAAYAQGMVQVDTDLESEVVVRDVVITDLELPVEALETEDEEVAETPVRGREEADAVGEMAGPAAFRAIGGSGTLADQAATDKVKKLADVQWEFGGVVRERMPDPATLDGVVLRRDTGRRAEELVDHFGKDDGLTVFPGPALPLPEAPPEKQMDTEWAASDGGAAHFAEGRSPQQLQADRLQNHAKRAEAEAALARTKKREVWRSINERDVADEPAPVVVPMETEGSVARQQAGEQRERRAYEVQLDGERLEQLLARANAAHQRGELEKAQELAKQALRLNQADMRAHELLVRSRRAGVLQGQALDSWSASDSGIALPIGPVPPVNPWQLSEQDHLSTFAIDTDSASLRVAAAAIAAGYLPPAASVRMEEFINAVDYHYPGPVDAVFAVHSEQAPAPFATGNQLVRIGVKGKVLGRDQRKASHLVLVVDASGSMDTPDRLPLLKRSLRRVVAGLGERDEVTLISYGGGEHLLLERCAATERDRLVGAIEALQATGSTNLLGGLRLGLQKAAQHYRAGRINQVLLCSDGIANVGAVDSQQILDEVAGWRRQGIGVSTVGFGRGAYNDDLLEHIAGKGDGHYLYIDGEEAAATLAADLADSLQVIARDAKIQVAFDPAVVRRWRLIGYENRAIADQDFRNDSVDAGEVGSGQAATALYEIELQEGAAPTASLGTVAIRYHDPATGRVDEVGYGIGGFGSATGRTASIQQRPRFYLAACLAEFAELLRGSPHAADGSLDAVLAVMREVAVALPNDDQVQALLGLMQRARGLPRRSGGNP